MDYKYDVFISYKKNDTSQEWIENIFIKKFKDFLESALAHLDRPIEIFYDRTGIDGGEFWPEKIKSALFTSRSMVAICSPEYFWRSEWCPREMASMLYRTQLVKSKIGASYSSFILPLLFMDFPKEKPCPITYLQYIDYRDFNLTGEAFWKSEVGLNFQKALRRDVNILAEMIKAAPKWQKNWIWDEKFEIFYKDFYSALWQKNNNNHFQTKLPGWAK